jgi:hypothetical protein
MTKGRSQGERSGQYRQKEERRVQRRAQQEDNKQRQKMERDGEIARSIEKHVSKSLVLGVDQRPSRMFHCCLSVFPSEGAMVLARVERVGKDDLLFPLSFSLSLLLYLLSIFIPLLSLPLSNMLICRDSRGETPL